MGNEVGLIKLIRRNGYENIEFQFPSPMGNEVGLMAPFWRLVFSRALEPIRG